MALSRRPASPAVWRAGLARARLSAPLHPFRRCRYPGRSGPA